MMKFGNMTDNDIGKNPLNFGHNPEEALSVSRESRVDHVATR